jgi:hypothetical protein
MCFLGETVKPTILRANWIRSLFSRNILNNISFFSPQNQFFKKMPAMAVGFCGLIFLSF